ATAFKPIDLALQLLGVYNNNYIDVEERNVVNPNPQNGTTREKEFWSLQEAFAEIHLRDLSNNYDFISLRVGMQPFVSDFRGFIFNDTNLGIRIFGNYDNNSRHYDKNGFITRPAPIGTVVDHYLQAYYLGWTGDGHIGWLNIDHAFYQVLGEDGLNGIAGRRVDINAQMAALELSVDK